MSIHHMNLRLNLRKLLDTHEAKTGLKVSYAQLSSLTGLSVDTLKSLATRNDYNVTLETVSQIARALKVDPREFLEWTAGT